MKSSVAFFLLTAAIQVNAGCRIKLKTRQDWRLVYEDEIGLKARFVSPKHARYFNEMYSATEGCASTIVGPVTSRTWCFQRLPKSSDYVLKNEDSGEYVVIPPATDDETVAATYTDDVRSATYIVRVRHSCR